MVFIETFITSAYLSNKKRDQSSNEEEYETIKPKGFGGGILGIIIIIMFLIYAVSILVLWGRMVFEAFKCSSKQGFASIFVPVHYNLYKFADLISISCKNNQYPVVNTYTSA